MTVATWMSQSLALACPPALLAKATSTAPHSPARMFVVTVYSVTCCPGVLQYHLVVAPLPPSPSACMSRSEPVVAVPGMPADVAALGPAAGAHGWVMSSAMPAIVAALPIGARLRLAAFPGTDG